MAAIIYEDTPRYDVWFKAIILLPAFFLLLAAFQLIGNEKQSALGLFAIAALMVAIFWAVIPRKYCILEDRLRIILGGFFRFDVPFASIDIARKPEGVTFGINFATSMHNRNAVQIIRPGKINVNITPTRPEEFITQLNKALDYWRGYKGKTW